MSEWQPIETAPTKDGFVCLVSVGGKVMPAEFGGSDWRDCECSTVRRWYLYGYGPNCHDSERIAPSHWMPLPEPPK